LLRRPGDVDSGRHVLVGVVSGDPRRVAGAAESRRLVDGPDLQPLRHRDGVHHLAGAQQLLADLAEVAAGGERQWATITVNKQVSRRTGASPVHQEEQARRLFYGEKRRQQTVFSANRASVTHGRAAAPAGTGLHRYLDRPGGAQARAGRVGRRAGAQPGTEVTAPGPGAIPDRPGADGPSAGAAVARVDAGVAPGAAALSARWSGGVARQSEGRRGEGAGALARCARAF